MSARYSVQAVELTMEVTGLTDQAGPVNPRDVVRLPVVRYSDVWGVNAVPQAQATLAVGRGGRGLTQSPVHARVLDGLRDKMRARVYATVTPTARVGPQPPGRRVPEGRFLVWDGYTAGAAFRADGAEFTVALEHWVADLDYCSAISPTSHPGNPSMFTFPAVFPADTGDARAAGYLLAGSVSDQFFQADTVRDDLWAAKGGARGVAAWLLHLASADSMDSGRLIQAGGRGPNLDAQAALRRFEPLADGKYVAGVPLGLDVAGAADADELAFAVSRALSAETPLTMANHTAWDRLLEYAQQFLFAVVPLVDRALVVPLTPGLRQPWATIRADEYGQGGWTAETSRLLRGVGVYAGRPAESGADVAAGPGVDYSEFGIGGYYLDPGRPGGLFKVVEAPGWMTTLPVHRYAKDHLGGGGRPVPNAAAPGVQPARPAPDPAKAVAARAPFLDRYAQALYLMEALRGRTRDVSGVLRYDIAPGSVVEVQSAREGLSVDDALADVQYATVRQVAHSYDAEAPHAGTTFRLADARSAAENGPLSGLAADRHPLWSTPWRGAAMVRGV